MKEVARFMLTLVPMTVIIAVTALIIWSGLVWYTTWLVCRVIRSMRKVDTPPSPTRVHT